MKIGVICSKPPFPIIDGGNFASKVLIDSLNQNNELHAIIIETDKHPFTESTLSFCKTSFESYSSVYLNTKINILGFLRSLLTGESYNLKRFSDSKLQHEISQLLAKDIDILILDSLYSAVEIETIKQTFKGKIILRTHNIEFEIWQQLADKATNPIKRKLFTYFSKKIKESELKIFNQVDEIWAISSKDDVKIKELSKKSVFHIEIGVNSIQTRVQPQVFSAFHIGGMNWLPNKESAEFLIHEIWQEDFTQPLQLIGNGTSELSSLTSNKHIHFCGRVEDLNEVYSFNSVLIAPILSGSGIRVKILEALSNGIPCITTNRGAEGIDVESSGVLIAENKSEFRAKINTLATDRDLLSTLSNKALKYMKENHSFEVVTQKINERIK